MPRRRRKSQPPQDTKAWHDAEQARGLATRIPGKFVPWEQLEVHCKNELMAYDRLPASLRKEIQERGVTPEIMDRARRGLG